MPVVPSHHSLSPSHSEDLHSSYAPCLYHMCSRVGFFADNEKIRDIVALWFQQDIHGFKYMYIQPYLLWPLTYFNMHWSDVMIRHAHILCMSCPLYSWVSCHVHSLSYSLMLLLCSPAKYPMTYTLNALWWLNFLISIKYTRKLHSHTINKMVYAL